VSSGKRSDSRAVLDLNFLDRLAAMIVGTSNPPH
jgi:hypothetical protein